MPSRYRPVAGSFGCFLISMPSGIVRADFVQRHQVRGDEAQQHQRERDHVEREEAVERDVGDRVVAADPHAEALADERHASRTG